MVTAESLGNRMSVIEVATEYGVTDKTVRNWINHGVRGVRLASLRIGGRKFVPRESLTRFIEDLNAGAPDSPEQRAVMEVLGREDDARCEANLKRLLSLRPVVR